MDEPWELYIKWEKLDTKGQVVWFHVHEISRIKQIPRDRKEIGDFQGIIRGENGKLLLNEHRLSI